MPEVATETLSCPRCRTANPPQARFCGTCGQPMQGQAGSPVPPPPAPVAPPPPPPVLNRGLLLGGASGALAPIVVNTDAPTAFALALRAVEGAKAKVLWQGAPQSARFEAVHRSFMMTGGFKVTYDGTLTFVPAGPRQTQVAMDLTTRNSSLVPLIAIDIVCTFLLVGGAAAAPTMAMLMLALGLGMTVWQVWTLSHNVKDELAQAILRSLSEAAFAAPAESRPAPEPAPAVRRDPPNPGPVGPGAAVPPPAKSVTDQLRELGELRQLGVLTDAEFEAKKAELLARI